MNLLSLRWPLLFCLSLLLLTPAAAQATPPRQTETQPSSQIRRVKVNFFVLSLQDIDSERSTYRVDLYLDLYWDEPALRGRSLADVDESTLWNPQIYLPNARSSETLFAFYSDSLEPNTNLRMSYRIVGTYDGNFDLRKFPFDSQELVVAIESEKHDNNTLVFEYLTNDTAQPEARLDSPLVRAVPLGVHVASTVQLNEWKLTGAQSTQALKMLEYDKSLWPSFQIGLAIERNSEASLWKIFALTALLMALGWSVLWIDPQETRFRLLVLFTLLLATVVHDLATTALRPHVPYLTFADLYFLAAYALYGVLALFLWVAYFVDTLQHRIPLPSAQSSPFQNLTPSNLPQLSARVQRAGLIGYPLLLGVVNLLLFWYGLS
ncbi:MAG: hypothetical protein ACKO9F_20720 [Caldilinea sp.]